MKLVEFMEHALPLCMELKMEPMFFSLGSSVPRANPQALNEAEGRYDIRFPLKEEHKPLVGLHLSYVCNYVCRIQSLLSNENHLVTVHRIALWLQREVEHCRFNRYCISSQEDNESLSSYSTHYLLEVSRCWASCGLTLKAWNWFRFFPWSVRLNCGLELFCSPEPYSWAVSFSYTPELCRQAVSPSCAPKLLLPWAIVQSL